MRTAVLTKRTISIMLAVVLATIIIPFSAFAENLVIRGTVTNVDTGTITVSVNGSTQVFYKTGISRYVNVGDEVRITVDSNDPMQIIEITVIQVGNPPTSTRHTHYSVTGKITDATMNTVTIFYRNQYRTFGREDARLVGAHDGIAIGDTVRIVYNSDDPQTAVEIRMIAHGHNHDNVRPQEVAHYSVTGPIVDISEDSITLYYRGDYRTFDCEDAMVSGARDGLAIGDTVKITYHRDSPDVAVQIRMIRMSDDR